MPHATPTLPAPRSRPATLVALLLAVVLAVTAAGLLPLGARVAYGAARLKAVVIVGPSAGLQSSNLARGEYIAAVAESYGMDVRRVFHPNATWSAVLANIQGASIVVYLGHGNGWPSPYAPFSTTSKDGMGLNATSGSGNSNTKYYGEYYMAKLGLAPNAVVMLNRLCYASGNSEWGASNPTRSTAIKRVDNYGYGFLRSGAKAVFASGITGMGYVLKGLFTGSKAMTIKQLFWTDPNRTGSYKFGFTSVRTPGASAQMDPYKPSRYYRSVIGWLGVTVGDWRAG